MKERQCYEFVATPGKDGVYECGDLRIPIEPTADMHIAAEQTPETREKIKAHLDVNKVFFESYQSNLNAEKNELLRQAQANLFEMQKRILDTLKRNW